MRFARPSWRDREPLGVFHRRLREGKWPRVHFEAATRQYLHDDTAGFWTWLPLDSTIVEAAVRAYTTLPDNVYLRSADCLHLVTALHHGFSDIYTHDTHQFAVAPALGLRAIRVEP